MSRLIQRLVGGVGVLPLIAGAALMSASPADAAQLRDFKLGVNGEQQACRAVLRFDGGPDVEIADLYCGAWERPTGRVAVTTDPAKATAALRALCSGAVTPITDPDLGAVDQLACARQEDGLRRFGLKASHGRRVVVGAAYPADWASLLAAAKVMSRAVSIRTVERGTNAKSAGQEQIQAAYPEGAPGQGAAANYELLRRRAYDRNATWSFAGAEGDFAQLLRVHKTVAPDDLAGEGEILAEIGLNLSNVRRFEEARTLLDQADQAAEAAKDPLLKAKIANYRVMDQLNQRHFAQALELAQAARGLHAGTAGGTMRGEAITAAQTGEIDGHPGRASRRGLLMSLGEASANDRAAVLEAQSLYLAAVAERALGQTQAVAADLDRAAALLDDVEQSPVWLAEQIVAERAELLLDAGDQRGAAAELRRGLALVQAAGAGTRTEAHLWLTLEKVQARQGDTAAALASGRRGVAIFAHQTETPGMPAEIAAGHLKTLLDAWSASKDPALSAEYFETLALVWDGAAARSAAQLAARLALSEGGAQARAYQDAERAQRAALTVQQRLLGENAPPAAQDAAAAAVKTAAARLTTAEDALRQLAPRYLELVSPNTSVADLKAALRPKEGYLRIVVGSEGGFGALVTRDGVRPYAIDLTTEQAEKLATGVRRSTTLKRGRLPDFDLVDSTTLYQALLAPLDGDLEGLGALQIDVGGPLASVPFAALVRTTPSAEVAQQVASDQNYSQVDWLGRHVSLASALGPAAFVRLRGAAPVSSSTGSVAIFGDFTPDPKAVARRLADSRGLSDNCRKEIERSLALLEALPDTASEAHEVAGIFGDRARVRLGGDFTDSDFIKSPEVGDAGVILLATHGVLGLSSCFAEPALLTSLGADGDGLIEASALLDRKLKARLVVLSACDTAGGGRMDAGRTGLADGGEALSGLARGFIYAGAADVLATQWKVDSASSAQQMHAFFEAAGREGMDLGRALSASQRKIYESPETGHPFYWAAFELIGDGSVSIGR